MSETQALRIPAPVVLLLAAMTLACASTPESDSGGTTSSYAPEDSYSSPSYQPTPTDSPLPPPPVFPAYIPELDPTKPPEYPRRADVSIQYGAPQKPIDDFWATLESQYNVSAYRGNGGTDLYFDTAWKLGDVECLLVSESVTRRNNDGSSTQYAHGFAIGTFDYSNHRPMENVIIETSDPYLYMFGYMRDGSLHGPVWMNDLEIARRGGENKLRFIASYEYGSANGECRWYDDNLYITATCNFRNGKRNGTYTSWGANGSRQAEYINGAEYGRWALWDSAGRMTLRGQAYDSHAYGRLEYWSPDSDHRYSVDYHRLGESRGWRSTYHKDGYLWYQVWYDNEVRNGPFVQYDPDGYVVWKGQYEQGLSDGAFTHFDADGRKDMEKDWLRGRATGAYRLFNTAGVMTHERSVIGSEYRSVLRTYHADGWVEYESELIHDEKNGRSRRFWVGGRTRWEGQTKNGKNEGTFIDYYETGEKFAETNYSGGELHGKRIFYDKDGTILRELVYSEGEVISDTGEGESPADRTDGPERKPDSWSPLPD